MSVGAEYLLGAQTESFVRYVGSRQRGVLGHILESSDGLFPNFRSEWIFSGHDSSNHFLGVL